MNTTESHTVKGTKITEKRQHYRKGVLTYRFPLLCMQVGDSIVVMTKQLFKRMHAQAARDEVAVRTRAQKTGGWRVWRTVPTDIHPNTLRASITHPNYAGAWAAYPIDRGVAMPTRNPCKKIDPPTALVTMQVADAGPSVPSVRLQTASGGSVSHANRPAHVADTVKEFTITIEKGIKPPPPKGASRHDMVAMALRKMEVGDSFISPPTVGYGVHREAKRCGIKCATKKTPKGIRVWRIA